MVVAVRRRVPMAHRHRVDGLTVERGVLQHGAHGRHDPRSRRRVRPRWSCRRRDDRHRPRPPSGDSSRRRSHLIGDCGDRRPSASLAKTAGAARGLPRISGNRRAVTVPAIGQLQSRLRSPARRIEPESSRARQRHSRAGLWRHVESDDRRFAALRAGGQHHPVRTDAHQLRGLQVEDDDHGFSDERFVCTLRRCRRRACVVRADVDGELEQLLRFLDFFRRQHFRHPQLHLHEVVYRQTARNAKTDHVSHAERRHRISLDKGRLFLPYWRFPGLQQFC